MIDSKPFGPVRLTGKDAVLFKQDLEAGTPDAAMRLFELGQAMLPQFLATGEVDVAPAQSEEGVAAA